MTEASIWNLYGYAGRLAQGAWVTLEVSLLSLLLALILGTMTALAKLSRTPWHQRVGTTYTTVIRGIPDLVLMLLLFYGIQVILNGFTDKLWQWFEWDVRIIINEFAAGVFTIGLIFGAYMGETIRGAILAVDRGQLEAAHAFGMSPRKVYQRILFPQMVRHAIPGIGNNWLVLLKTTALISILGLHDMVKVARDAAVQLHKPFFFLIPVAIVYLLLTIISEIGLKKIERRYAIQERH